MIAVDPLPSDDFGEFGDLVGELSERVEPGLDFLGRTWGPVGAMYGCLASQNLLRIVFQAQTASLSLRCQSVRNLNRQFHRYKL